MNYLGLLWFFPSLPSLSFEEWFSPLGWALPTFRAISAYLA